MPLPFLFTKAIHKQTNNMNKVILCGRVGKDPDTRTLESGNTVSNFPLATSEVYKDKTGNKVENTEWHNLVAWNMPVVNYIKKGSQILVEGKLETRSWEKDGITRYTTEIKVSHIELIDSKVAADSGANKGAKIEEPVEMESGDLPF